MPVISDAGPRLYQYGSAVATLSLTPLFDRAAKLRRIWVTAPSAKDTWVLSVSGRQMAKYIVDTVGAQQLLGNPTNTVPKSRNIFDWVEDQLNMDISYPVPEGQTITLSSAGGATADVIFEYVETDTADMANPGLVNHYLGNHLICPVYLSKAAAITAAGENDFDTIVRPDYIPPIMITPASTGVPVVMPVNWTLKVLAMFTEGGGVNTYSGSADHQSATDYAYFVKDGQRMFSRQVKGVPLIGAASAAGSANKVFNELDGPYPPFQSLSDEVQPDFPRAIQINGGDTWQCGLNITGSLTGGADYSSYYQVLLVDVMYRSSGPLVTA